MNEYIFGMIVKNMIAYYYFTQFFIEQHLRHNTYIITIKLLINIFIPRLEENDEQSFPHRRHSIELNPLN